MKRPKQNFSKLLGFFGFLVILVLIIFYRIEFYSNQISHVIDVNNMTESKIIECTKFSDLTSFCLYENVCLKNKEFIFFTKNESLLDKMKSRNFEFNGKINLWDHYEQIDSTGQPINRDVKNPLPFRSFLNGRYESASIWYNSKIYANGCHSVLFFDSPNQNVFHWSMKISPLFIYLNFHKNNLCPAFDSIRILNRKSTDLSDWQKNFLQLSTDININNVNFGDDGLQCFKYMFVPGTAIYLFTGPIEAIYLREKVGKKFNLDFRRSRVVFVKRKNRLIVNQNELENFIKSKTGTYDFDSIYFDDLNFEQQVKKMSQTKLLISVHGAGLTNAIFMPSTSIVVEITPPHFHYPLYERITTQSGHVYFRFVTQPDPTIHSGKFFNTKSSDCFKSGDCIVFWRDSNMVVNITKFSFLFEQIMEVI